MMDISSQASSNKSKFPKIMAIINATSDSFSDGGDYYSFDKALNYVKYIIDNNLADILDIGGESTRPGAKSVPVNEEINRTIPLIEAIRNYNSKIIISIDTTKYDVAKKAADAGVNIINDISGLTADLQMGELAALHNLEYVIMHKKGTPKDMQIDPNYDNVVKECFTYLQKQIDMAKSLGIKKIYSDVGIGFGKTYEHNIELLRNLSYFNKLEVPMLLGISRKAFIGKMLDIESPKERDLATLLIHAILLKENIEIIRLHKVEEFKTLKKIYEEIG